MTTNLYVCYALMAAGVAGHFLKKLADLEVAGTILSPLTYLKQHPYTAALAVLGGYLALTVFYYIGQLNEVTAILTGVGCTEAYDSLRARAAGKMRNGSGQDAATK